MPRGREIREALERELADAGIPFVAEHGGKHPCLRFVVRTGETRTLFFSKTPSCRRGQLNAVARLRRLIAS